MRSIGIDIGTSSIKVVEAQSTNRGIQILSFLEHPLGQNPTHDPEIEILEFLQSLTASLDFTQTKVVMALRQERVSVRLKTFPFTDRLKILKSLPFELEEDLPFSFESAIYDSRTVRFLGAQAEVMACATPRHRVAEFMGRFQSTGLPISALSAEGLAFANCFENWSEPPPQLPEAPMELEPGEAPQRPLKLVIQLGHTHTLVAAFENDRLVGIRSILWGGQNVAEAIARKYEIPYIEALREMRTKAFILPSKEGASYDQIVFSDTISAQLRELGQELRLSILEIETELGGKVHDAEITGGLAGIMHLGPYLTQLIEVPVNPASYLNRFPGSIERSPAVENVVGTALGLAIEGLRKPRNPGLQFLRGEFAPQNETLQLFWDTWGLSVKVAAGVFAVLVVHSIFRDSMALSLLDQSDQAMRDQAKTVAGLPARQANESGLKQYIRNKRKRAQEMKELEGLARMNSALEILKRVSESSPGRAQLNMNVSSVRIIDDQVVIEGMVGNAKEKSDLQRALASVARDGKVNPGQNPPPRPGMLGIPFAFSFAVDRGTR